MINVSNVNEVSIDRPSIVDVSADDAMAGVDINGATDDNVIDDDSSVIDDDQPGFNDIDGEDSLTVINAKLRTAAHATLSDDQVLRMLADAGVKLDRTAFTVRDGQVVPRSLDR